MYKGIRYLALFTLALATMVSATPPVPSPPSPNEGRLVEYEVTLRQVPTTDAASVLLRIAAAHHGIVTKLDAGAGRATITLPASRGADLKGDAFVTATLSPGTSSGRHFKPVAMTTFLGGSGTYTYDGAGNIKTIGSDSFTYDAVNRLTSGTVRPWKANAPAGTQTYSYDPFGNRLAADALNHGCAGGMDCAINVTIDPTTNRITKATIAATDYPVTYDDAGNALSFAGTSFGYDALGNMVTRNDGQAPQFVYDASDERVGIHNTTQSTSQWTWTLRDVSGRQLREYTAPTPIGRTTWDKTSWTWTRDHIYGGGQLLASVTPSGSGTVTQHMHVDHLGTPRVITEDGFPVGVKAYYAFGAEMASAPIESPEENHQFTGHEFDDAQNGRFATDYMHARYYSPTVGRFLSVDPSLDLEKAVDEPQLFNRYAYVTNNPLRYTDPDGRERLPCAGFAQSGRCAPVPWKGWKTESLEMANRGLFVATALGIPLPGEGVLGRALGAAGRFLGLGAFARGSVLLETAIARGAVREGGALGKIIGGIEAGFKAGAPKSGEAALELVAKSAEAVGKEPGTLVKASEGAQYVLQNVGDVKTFIYKTGEIIVKKGDELLVRYVPK